MSITIKDVAKMAGVSFSTVSKVINRSPTISPTTIERVNAAIKELDYHPNITARNFAKKSTRNIAFIMKIEKNVAFTMPHLFEIMCGLQQALAKKNYTLTILSTDSEESEIELLKKIATERSADGIVLHGSVVTRGVAALMKKLGFPHLAIGKLAFESTISWVDTNNMLSGEIAANFLFKRGYKRPAFIGGSEEDFITGHRLRGVQSAAEGAGSPIPECYIKLGDSTKERSAALMDELLGEDERPDSVVCSNNSIAIGAVKSIKARGLAIPVDIAVISFDDYPFSRMIEPMLTVVDIDMFDMGLQVGVSILRMIKNPSLQMQSYTTIPVILEREST